MTLARPAENESVRSNPFTISGTARTFENNVSIRILDGNGMLILQTSATASGELGSFNSWEREILLGAHPGGEITIEAIEFSAEDGSILSLVSRTVQFEVPPRTVTLYVHDPERAANECRRVFPLSHELPATPAIARAMVDALMRLPGNPFPRGSDVNRIALRDGVLTIDFNETLRNVGGSCRAQAIRASIEHTLGELPGVNRVEITAAGSSGQALQP